MPIDDHTFLWWLRVAGAEKDFTAQLTEVQEGERLAWKTVRAVQHGGVVTFHHLSDDQSRVTLQIDYEPRSFVEALGALTDIEAVLSNYDLSRFQTS